MKKIISVALVLMVIIGGVIWYNQTHFTGYVYRNSGISYDNGFARGDKWINTGEQRLYSFNELKELGKDHNVKISGFLGGPSGLVFELSEDTILVVPDLSFDSGIAESYGLF